MPRTKWRRALTPRKRRHVRVRAKVHGTARRPRLNVYRSSAHIYAQVIDDVTGTTMVSACDLDQEVLDRAGEGAKKMDKAKAVGAVVAERAKAQGVETVVFDRAGNKYHGRIAALADGARSGGLTF